MNEDLSIVSSEEQWKRNLILNECPPLIVSQDRKLPTATLKWDLHPQREYQFWECKGQGKKNDVFSKHTWGTENMLTDATSQPNHFWHCVGSSQKLADFIVQGQRPKVEVKNDVFSKHIPGTENKVADALSQLNHYTFDTIEDHCENWLIFYGPKVKNKGKKMLLFFQNPFIACWLCLRKRAHGLVPIWTGTEVPALDQPRPKALLDSLYGKINFSVFWHLRNVNS